MAYHLTEEPRKSRKKSSHSSKTSKSRSSGKKIQEPQSKSNLNGMYYAPAVQAVSTSYLRPAQPYPQPVRSPRPTHPAYTASPPPHPVYGRTPQHPPQYGQLYGSPPTHPAPPYANYSSTRFNTPPPKSREDGPFKEHWDKLDRVAAKSYADLREGACKSASKMTTNYIERPTHAVAMKSMQALCQGAALCDIITSKFDSVITSMDGEKFSGKEQDLRIYENSPPTQSATSTRSSPPPVEIRGQGPNAAHQMLGGDKGSNYFSKVWLYSNSRLPPHLPPFKVYLPTYPLLCLAATYSERVYTPPSKSRETETHIPSDWRTGTKAMVLKSVPVDDMNTVVFAIRGTGSFMDWAVNYNSAPVMPDGFLEDASNLCHAGFLYVAKRMVKPVADRLRVLLEENPARSNCSLLITGHSAGGAVAALLYSHMMSNKVESELSYLTAFFKRVHCVTFGAPPISLRSLQKPEDSRHRKSLFYAFVNEGDPIPRADKPFIKSLLRLYVTPAPSPSVGALGTAMASMSKVNVAQVTPSSPPKSRFKGLLPSLSRPSKASLQTASTGASALSGSASTSTATHSEWKIPQSTLAPAGRLVVLRPRLGPQRVSKAGNVVECIEAVTVDEEKFRRVVYGDPEKHQMVMYRKRIEQIATRAVTAGNC